MLRAISVRLRQGRRTIRYPAGPPPSLSDRYRGLPVLVSGRCPADCHLCLDACPTGAMMEGNTAAGGRLMLDVGKCLFCAACQSACPNQVISFSREYRMSARNRRDLMMAEEQLALPVAAELDAKMKRLFGHSLKLRQVSAGGCNACEADVNVLGTLAWDLGRFGIQFVASPRHADGLLITGPVTKNMELALRKTYEAVPDPKLVIAVGACAVSGGLYVGREAVSGGTDGTLGGVNELSGGTDEPLHGAESCLPVDLFIPGCPPHPLTILEGLLRLVGRLGE